MINIYRLLMTMIESYHVELKLFIFISKISIDDLRVNRDRI